MDQLSLFDKTAGYRFPAELLEYHPGFLTAAAATALQTQLMTTTNWKQTTIKMYDKVLQTPRLIAWFGDAGKGYRLAGKDIAADPWTKELLELKTRIEAFSGHIFNSVLLNYYRDQNDSVAWHRDKESELGNRPLIASVSLGQTRSFEFRAADDHTKKHALPLEHGSLLLMKGELQVYWEHRIAKSNKLMGPRINLTFRKVNTA